MAKISENFDDKEFACRCCGEIRYSPMLLKALQTLRDVIGKPIHITCAYRCEAHNTAIGGEKNSYHIQGMAADIHVDGMSLEELYREASKIPAFHNGGIGIYPEQNFIHVDVRNHHARWMRLGRAYLAIAPRYTESEPDKDLA